MKYKLATIVYPLTPENWKGVCEDEKLNYGVWNGDLEVSTFEIGIKKFISITNKGLCEKGEKNERIKN